MTQFFTRGKITNAELRKDMFGNQRLEIDVEDENKTKILVAISMIDDSSRKKLIKVLQGK